MPQKALVIFSGGQDSTTCLYWAIQTFAEVVAVTFAYAQRHHLEIESARKIAALAKVQHEVVDLGAVFAGSSPLTSKRESVAKYKDADSLPGGLEDTFVPGRNILFLCVAANRAYVAGCDNLVIGVTQEDFGGYPDCRADFIASMEQTLALGLERPLKIHAPLQHKNKRQIVELAQTLAGCMEALSFSTTCYEGVNPPCGQCHSCLLRARGFAEAGVRDPLTSIERSPVPPSGTSAAPTLESGGAVPPSGTSAAPTLESGGAVAPSGTSAAPTLESGGAVPPSGTSAAPTLESGGAVAPSGTSAAPTLDRSESVVARRTKGVVAS